MVLPVLRSTLERPISADDMSSKVAACAGYEIDCTWSKRHCPTSTIRGPRRYVDSDALRDEATVADVALELPAPTGLQVACSPGGLASVLQNLARNALKFLAGRPVRRIAVRAFAVDRRVRIEVEDTGPGIPCGQELSIFEPYVRLTTAVQVPGLGLGLATVKRIVEAYGGAVGVRALVDQGSCFWVELPAGAAPLAALAELTH